MLTIREYMEMPHTERKFASFNPVLLDKETCEFKFDLPDIQFMKMDKYKLIEFLVDFSCASSMLDGGSYSLMDSKALIEYGELNEDKPLEDAILVLNHQHAFKYIFENTSLSANNIRRVHALLTSDHNRKDMKASPHFLPKEQGGMLREYSEIEIAHCAYTPPFKPGTRFIEQEFNRMIEIANNIKNPLNAAFYLMTRLPYLQPFMDGNKRTSRVVCNVPLLNACLPPISFSDFNKKDYIVGLMAFYELWDERLLANCVTHAYTKSCARLKRSWGNSCDNEVIKTHSPSST